MDLSVLNLSQFTLNQDLTSLLKKGVGFCPTTQGDICRYKIDVYKYIRRLKIQKYLKMKPDIKKNLPQCNQIVYQVYYLFKIYKISRHYFLLRNVRAILLWSQKS